MYMTLSFTPGKPALSLSAKVTERSSLTEAKLQFIEDATSPPQIPEDPCNNRRSIDD